ncbi:kinase-like domain-containing protein [Rhodocollybia butyracea]|uniref:Kinase-like domain-containing protein n=1 Tax=Rhodocollybia butyracea TaxID=206335 RepID=A0A9P5PJI0_9AGAR|nr:kinase-like domain-containing protein [Rhodocollybia butyracea]
MKLQKPTTPLSMLQALIPLNTWSQILVPTRFLTHCFSSHSSLHVKIADFGEAFLWSPDHPEIHDSHCPNAYAAPEILFDRAASPASDIWAMGVIVFFVLTGGFFPFEGKQVAKMISLVGPLPSRWHEKWLLLMNPDDPFQDWKAPEHDENAKWLCDVGIVDEEAKADRDKAEKILRQMFQYKPEMRASAQEVAELLDDLMTGLDIETVALCLMTGLDIEKNRSYRGLAAPPRVRNQFCRGPVGLGFQFPGLQYLDIA